jgi:hypothetical protein
LKEEEARIQRMKEEEAEKAEFDKWKDAFTVDNEGTLGDSQEESGGLLEDFVQYIKVYCFTLIVYYIFSDLFNLKQ